MSSFCFQYSKPDNDAANADVIATGNWMYLMYADISGFRLLRCWRLGRSLGGGVCFMSVSAVMGNGVSEGREMVAVLLRF